MRDLDRWKDKVEISLDGRQIFFLFFGSAVAACLIFVVGVLIGKRIEARALALQPAPIEDPLAALDQLGDADEADDGLTFHKALTPPAREKVEKQEKGEKQQKLEKPKPVELAGPPSLDKAGEGGEEREPVKEARVEVKPEPKKPAPVKAATAPLPAAKPQVVQAAPVAGKTAAPKKPDAAVAHFTLQLSAFPDKGDAEEFMRKIQAAGYKPFLVASEIPGKGVFFRVRVGDFASRQAAVDAKVEFERKQRIIAYVAKL
jgi:cell division septation protein DedD